jgi:hypothetical protein
MKKIEWRKTKLQSSDAPIPSSLNTGSFSLLNLITGRQRLATRGRQRSRAHRDKLRDIQKEKEIVQRGRMTPCLSHSTLRASLARTQNIVKFMFKINIM